LLFNALQLHTWASSSRQRQLGYLGKEEEEGGKDFQKLANCKESYVLE